MMKTITAFSAMIVACVAAFGQVSVDNSSGVVTSSPGDSVYNPTVSQLGGGAIEYKDLRPDLSLSLLSVSAAVGYESQYMFRAEKRAEHSIQPKVEFAYPLYGFDVYVGAWANTPINGDKGGLTEIDLYGGVNYYYQSLRFDVGYIFYYYPTVDTPATVSRDMEVYTGVTWDTAPYLSNINLNPSIYYFYNWVLDQQVVETSIGYNTPVGEWFIDDSRVTFPVRVYGGYLSAGKKNGDSSQGATYFYWGVSGDIAIAVTKYCTISGGMRFSMRQGGNEGAPTNGYDIMGRADNIWFGGKVDFGF